MDWFKSLHFIFPNTKALVFPLNPQALTDIQEYLGTMSHRMDTGIIKVSEASPECDLRDLARDLSMPQDVVYSIRATECGVLIFRVKCYLFLKEKQQIKQVEIKFTHRLADQEVP